jgi:hypothetical protein
MKRILSYILNNKNEIVKKYETGNKATGKMTFEKVLITLLNLPYFAARALFPNTDDEYISDEDLYGYISDVDLYDSDDEL